MAFKLSLPPDPALAAFAELHKAQKGFSAPIPSTCDVCTTDFPSKTALEAHAREVHPKEPPFNDELREKYLEQIRLGKRPHKTARLLGISPHTVKRATKIDPTFADACELAEEEASEDIEDKLRERALDGDPWAVTKWLTKRSQNRWSDDKTINVNVSGTIQHSAELLPHEAKILALQETVRERSRLNGTYIPLDNPEIIDAEIID